MEPTEVGPKVVERYLPMTLDRWAADLGMVQMAGEDADKAIGLMQDAAYDFMKAGGTLQWTDWLTMGPLTRKAFSNAQALVEKERAAHILSMVVDAITKLMEA